MDILNFGLEFKEVSEDGVFEGYASTFNNVDLGQDKVIPGAFTRTLKKSKGLWPILADHNTRVQIGWNTEAVEDSKGLKVRGKLDLNVQAARERLSLAKSAKEIGAKMGLSIGYEAVGREWDGDIRLLKDLEMYEYSFVAFPMNRKATVTNIKNLLSPDGDLITDVRTFENALRDVGFSNQQAKAIASFSFKLKGQCDVDEYEAKELMTAIEEATNALKS